MNYICESCGSDLKYYDKVSRMVRTKNRKVSIITVKRFKCPVCNCIHRNLPNNIFPYKQYDARIITGVIEGSAINNVEKAQIESKTSPEDEERFHKLLNTIFTICELAGFHIEGRIAIKDCKTGKIWR